MPGTAPTGWQTPKTSYDAEDVLTPEQFERIEGNAYAAELGSRTIDPSQAPSGLVGTLRQFIDWFANRIQAITGGTNWYDAPAATLATAKSHIDAAAPHSGHETPSGAQAKVDTHADLTAPHSATSAATANRIVLRDAAGRAKVAAPSADDDIARKDTVDAVQTNLDAAMHKDTGHKHTGAAGDAPVLPAYLKYYGPNDTLVHSHNAAVSTSSTSFVKKKTITIPCSGTFRVKFDLRPESYESASAWGQVYRNGSVIGTARVNNSSSSFQTFSEDLGVFMPGDTVELWVKTTNGSYFAEVQNFRLYGTPATVAFLNS